MTNNTCKYLMIVKGHSDSIKEFISILENKNPEGIAFLNIKKEHYERVALENGTIEHIFKGICYDSIYDSFLMSYTFIDGIQVKNSEKITNILYESKRLSLDIEIEDVESEDKIKIINGVIVKIEGEITEEDPLDDLTTVDYVVQKSTKGKTKKLTQEEKERAIEEIIEKQKEKDFLYSIIGGENKEQQNRIIEGVKKEFNKVTELIVIAKGTKEEIIKLESLLSSVKLYADHIKDLSFDGKDFDSYSKCEVLESPYSDKSKVIYLQIIRRSGAGIADYLYAEMKKINVSGFIHYKTKDFNSDKVIESDYKQIK